MSDKPALDPDDIDAVRGFDLAAWLDDSKPPQRSTVLYGRPDLYAEIDKLERQISIEGGSVDDETSVSQQSKLGKLQGQYRKVAEQIRASAMTFVVRAANEDAITQARRDARKENIRDIAKAEWDDQEMAADFELEAEDEAEMEDITDPGEVKAFVRKRVLQARKNYIATRSQDLFDHHLLVRLLVTPKASDVGQVRKLLDAVGPTQAQKLFELVRQTNQEVQVPSAPFLRPSSQVKRGGTSSKR